MNKWLSKIDYKKVNMIMDAISALSIIGMIVCTFFLWKNSSDRVPMHYNFNGEVDTYGSKSSMLILLFIDVICYVGIALLSKYPEVYNYCVEINEENREKRGYFLGKGISGGWKGIVAIRTSMGAGDF